MDKTGIDWYSSFLGLVYKEGGIAIALGLPLQGGYPSNCTFVLKQGIYKAGSVTQALR